MAHCVSRPVLASGGRSWRTIVLSALLLLASRAVPGQTTIEPRSERGADSSKLSVGCQVTRVVALGLGGFLGYNVGDIAGFPFRLSGYAEPATSALRATGVLAGIAYAATARVSRPLPGCPRSMSTVVPTNRLSACLPARLFATAMGGSAGTLVAGWVSVPFLFSRHGAATIRTLFVALPVSGAIIGAVRSQRSTDCTSSPQR